jgi:hypothetical protein
MNQLWQHIKKWENAVTLLLFAVLGIMALVLYQERIYADSAHYLYKVLDLGTFRIEHDRFILILSQLLPFVALKLGLSLKTIMISYSINHVLFPFGIFLICRYLYKNKTAGIVILALQTVGISRGFYAPMYELYYVCYFLVLFASALNSSHYSAPWVCYLSIFFITTGHFLALPMVVLILLFHGLDQVKIPWAKYAGFIGFVVLIFVLKSIFPSEYEASKVADFINAAKTLSFDAKYLKGLIQFLAEHYWGLLAIFIVASLLLFKHSKLKFAIYVSIFGSLLYIVNVAHYGFEYTRYHEQVYFPLVFAGVFPFTYILNRQSKANLRNILLVFIFGIIAGRMAVIWQAGAYYKGRTAEIKTYIATAHREGIKKASLDESVLIYPSNWSYSLESMLLSSIAGPQHTVSICTVQDLEFEENWKKVKSTDYLNRKWEIYPVSSLNERYFLLDKSLYAPIQKR